MGEGRGKQSEDEYDCEWYLGGEQLAQGQGHRVSCDNEFIPPPPPGTPPLDIVMAHRGIDIRRQRPLNLSIDIEVEMGPEEGALNAANDALPDETTPRQRSAQRRRAGRAGYINITSPSYAHGQIS